MIDRVDYISAHKSQMTFMELDFEADKPRIKAELRRIMAELKVKSNRTKLKALPRDIIITANRDEASHVNEY